MLRQRCKGGFNVGLFHKNMVQSVALKIIDKSTLQMVSQLYQFPLQSWSHDVSSLALRCVFASNLYHKICTFLLFRRKKFCHLAFFFFTKCVFQSAFRLSEHAIEKLQVNQREKKQCFCKDGHNQVNQLIVPFSSSDVKSFAIWRSFLEEFCGCNFLQGWS